LSTARTPRPSRIDAREALARDAGGRWKADIFDGLGCVEAFRRRGMGFAERRVIDAMVDFFC
jgi:shikimate dehydrogenase